MLACTKGAPIVGDVPSYGMRVSPVGTITSDVSVPEAPWFITVKPWIATASCGLPIAAPV